MKNARSIYLGLASAIFWLGCAAAGAPTLEVAPGGRHLQTTAGEPFFWLGDTAWELFHRLDLAEAERYLDARAEQGFNVVQAVVLAEQSRRAPDRRCHHAQPARHRLQYAHRRPFGQGR